MLHLEDVLKGVCEQHYPLTKEKYAYVIANFDRMAEDDPTGNLPVWVEQLLDECDDDDHITFVNKLINDIVEFIRDDYYANSDVILGEYLLDYEFPTNFNGYDVSNYVISQAIIQLIEWDEITWRYIPVLKDNVWVITEIDTVELDGEIYPVRTLRVEHDSWDGNVDYTIAPDSLLFQIEEFRDPETGYTHEYDHLDDEDIINECERVDDLIYHYVPDEFFYEDASYICEHQLDKPFKFVEEIF